MANNTMRTAVGPSLIMTILVAIMWGPLGALSLLLWAPLFVLIVEVRDGDVGGTLRDLAARLDPDRDSVRPPTPPSLRADPEDPTVNEVENDG